MTRGEYLGNENSFGARLGALVARKRQQEGISLATLAARIYPLEDPTGERRAPDILKFEKGQSRNPRARTVRRYQDALSITQEEIDALVDDDSRPHWRLTQQLIEQKNALARELKVSEQLAIEIAERYAEGNPGDLEAALRGLEHALQVAAEESRKNNLRANTDDEICLLLKRVHELNIDGKIDAATALIAEEEARAEAGLMRLYDKGIAQAVLARDVDTACTYELKKLALETPDSSKQFAATRDIQENWDQSGNEKGLNFDLEVAVALARVSCARASNLRESVSALNDLGNALVSLGDRQLGTALLEEAVEVFRTALEQNNRVETPLRWALNQLNIGVALRALGRRELDSGKLEEAITAYRAALEELTREDFPIEWARAKMNLGNLLQTIGTREAGKARLEEAVSAHREALQENTRDRVPTVWAQTQMNLGLSLLTLGQREAGTEHLDAAVAAFHAALEEHCRAEVPIEWARTQENLGIALKIIGEREIGTKKIVDSISKFRAALEVHTRDRLPLDWARTQSNLASALRVLGEREGSVALLQESVEILTHALEERTLDRVPMDYAMTQSHLADTNRAFFHMTGEIARLDTALTTSLAAKKVFEKAGMVHETQRIEKNISEIEAAKTE